MNEKHEIKESLKKLFKLYNESYIHKRRLCRNGIVIIITEQVLYENYFHKNTDSAVNLFLLLQFITVAYF